MLFHVDITGIKLRELQLRHEAERDFLTGLPNRAGAYRWLAHALAEGTSVTVMFIDLDGFKTVNDAYGHHAGDELLAKVASRLLGCVRSGDAVCRLGGDEFVVFCPGLGPDAAANVAARISEVMRRPFQVGPNTISVGASVGRARSTPDSTVETLLWSADAEMYEVKRSSRVVDGWQPPTEATQGTRRSTSVRDVRLSAVVNRSTDVAMFFDRDGTIAWASPASVRVFGVWPDELVGRSGFDLIHPDDSARVLATFAEGLTRSRGPVRVEFRLNDPSGAVRWVEETVCDLTDDPEVGFIVGNLRDVTERRAAEQAMMRLALVDELTGLPNRTALANALADLEAAPQQAGDVGLVLFDLDDFCDVNDTLGHDAGDALLLEVARRVRDAVPAGCMVARFGGDQFAVLMPCAVSAHACHDIAAMVQSSLAHGFRVGDHELMTAATLGLAIAPIDRARGLLRDADAALYRAKQTDRGGLVLFRQAIADDAMARLRRTGDLRRALTAGEIVAHYQPVIELATGRVIGVEALARWHLTGHGWVPPNEFILLAETTGLIEELGRRILEQSCIDAAEWLRQGCRLHVAVNASGVQLTNPSFPSTVDAALHAAGLPADQLTIEITETAAIRDPQASLIVLTALKERAIALSLDDFGTGYSPLAALRDLPVDAIKLDRTFVAGLGSPTGDGFATGIVQLGLAMGRRVVAEGVETQPQADQLRAIGCDYGQGFLWSPAVPAGDLLATIARIEGEVPLSAGRDQGTT